jgi:hypothetical protein
MSIRFVRSKHTFCCVQQSPQKHRGNTLSDCVAQFTCLVSRLTGNLGTGTHLSG